MKGMMAIAMVAVVYVLYVLLGAYKQFPIAYLDWYAPYFHYGIVVTGSLLSPLALPVVVIILAAAGWYRKSMRGEP